MNVISLSYQLHAALVGLALCDVLDIVQRDVKLKLNSSLDLKFKEECDSPGVLLRTQKEVFKSTRRLPFKKRFRNPIASSNCLIIWEQIFTAQYFDRHCSTRKQRLFRKEILMLI